ncbi:MAG: thiamine-phosphate kinase [Planctomycetes bacterium]|nr:thiamine-phosphate kinase [Planctomycetota bacterium]
MTASPNEFALIDWIRGRAGAGQRLVLGIGDDMAALRLDSAELLVAADMLLEGVHFTFPPAEPQDAGRKALAVNLSDVAAMAGRPLAATVSVALPRCRGAGFARELFEGVLSIARQFECAIAGGDTNLWDGPLVIDIAILAEPTGRGAVRRRGAQSGDWIFVTGQLGGSLPSGRHISFTPRVHEAIALHQSVNVHAMIDVSDGLAADLGHILDESGVGAVLVEERIPIHPSTRTASDGRSPLEHALGDGEDFELIFTVSPEDGQRLLERPPFETPLTHIGRIVPEPVLEIEDAARHRRPLTRTGWEHGFGGLRVEG